MPRQPSLDMLYVLHHVIVRGMEKRDIFADEADKERFIARLLDLLTTVSLPETMRRLLTSYAVYFNRKNNKEIPVILYDPRDFSCMLSGKFPVHTLSYRVSKQRAGIT